MEAKLSLLTTTTSLYQSDNERLKLILQRALIENEILRASVSPSSTVKRPSDFVGDPSLLSSGDSLTRQPYTLPTGGR